MDDSNHRHEAVQWSSYNSSVPSLPTNLLEAFIPGYNVISRFILEAFAIDITMIVSVLLLAWGLGTSASYMYEAVLLLFRRHCMSFISIDSEDDIFEEVVDWLTMQSATYYGRALMATSRQSSVVVTTPDSEGIPEDEQFIIARDADPRPLRFEPYYGTHRLFHEGRYFELVREVKRATNTNDPWSSSTGDKQTIRIYCVGRSTSPIKNLLRACRKQYASRNAAKTTVRRPGTRSMQRSGRLWQRVASRPSRPIETVVLASEDKKRVVSDMKEYLKPATARWYANRGIPYRRGYLFHGQPGTGKSSLCFALAGLLNLDIYCISLLDPSLGEEELCLLFNSLPRHCIVLLEDIDSAGLTRSRSGPKRDKNKHPGDDTDDEDSTSYDEDQGRAASVKGITLSGLLNAIDGVASQEGRILVLTTNQPEKLDDALIRRGRVDLQIAFTLAKREQIAELFLRMYSNVDSQNTTSHDDQEKNIRALSNRRPDCDTKMDIVIGAPAIAGTDQRDSGLSELAKAFAEKVPDERFSPAQIQSFLLLRKYDPQRALQEINEWLEQQHKAPRITE